LCRLCHVPSELRKSHIFPRSFIKLVRDEDTNRFYEMHDKVDNLIQDGPKERLLCSECEQRISRYEKYFKEAVHLSRHGIEILQAGGEAVIRNLDYANTKLFLLSILWRMSVSSLPQCEAVALGEKEEFVRRMLIRSDPGGSRQFPICAIILLINGHMDERWLCTPFTSTRYDVYALVIGGILYFVSVKEGHAYPSPKYLLGESGDWTMPLLEYDKVPFFDEFLNHHFGSEHLADGASEEDL
jgi:hypothetical protein